MEDHEHHEASLRVFLKTDRGSGCCAAHSLAEMYATFTRLPGKHRVSLSQVLLLLQNVRERLTIITLNTEEYFVAIHAAASAGVAGGTIYDAILARCALKAQAQIIYSWNTRHFRQLGGDVALRLATP